MPPIKLSKKHNKSRQEVDELVEKIKQELCEKHGLSATQCGDQVKFKGSGIDGNLCLGEQQVDITINIGLMMTMFTPQIEAAINQALDKHLG